MVLRLHQGQVVQDFPLEPRTRNFWKNLSIDTYDRMTVLYYGELQ